MPALFDDDDKKKKEKTDAVAAAALPLFKTEEAIPATSRAPRDRETSARRAKEALLLLWR